MWWCTRFYHSNDFLLYILKCICIDSNVTAYFTKRVNKLQPMTTKVDRFVISSSAMLQPPFWSIACFKPIWPIIPLDQCCPDRYLKSLMVHFSSACWLPFWDITVTILIDFAVLVWNVEYHTSVFAGFSSLNTEITTLDFLLLNEVWQF